MEIADTKERLLLINELSHLLIFRRKNKRKYIHMCTTKELADAENADWNGRVNAVKSAILDKIEILQASVDGRVEDLASGFKKLDSHTVDRFKTLQDNENRRV